MGHGPDPAWAQPGCFRDRIYPEEGKGLGASGVRARADAAHHGEGTGIFLRMGAVPGWSANSQSLIHTLWIRKRNSLKHCTDSWPDRQTDDKMWHGRLLSQGPATRWAANGQSVWMLRSCPHTEVSFKADYICLMHFWLTKRRAVLCGWQISLR